MNTKIDAINLFSYQPIVENQDTDPEIPIKLFLDALRTKQLQTAHLLVEQIDTSLISYSIDIYRSVFECSDTELIEKVLSKWGVSIVFFEVSELMVLFYTHHPALFQKWIQPELVLFYYGADKEFLFETLMTLAIFRNDKKLSGSCWQYAPQGQYLDHILIKFLKTAITIGNQEFTALFCQWSGIPHEPFAAFPDELLFLSLQHGNEIIIDTVMNAYKQKKVTPHFPKIYERILATTTEHPQETINLLIRTTKLLKSGFTEAEYEELSQELMHIKEFSSVLVSFITSLSSASTFSLAKTKISRLSTFVEALSKVCKIPYGTFSLHDTANWLMEQIFCHCQAMNPKLFSDQALLDTIVELIARVCRDEDYNVLIIALQVATHREYVVLAFQAAQHLGETSGIKPSKEVFVTCSTLQQKQWLSYASVFRDRSFIPHCYYIVKYHDSHAEILLYALHAIHQIATCRYNSELENTLALELEKILQKSELEEGVKQEEVKIALFQAYLSITSVSHNLPLLDFLFQLLEEARKNHLEKFEAEICRGLGREYEWTSEAECQMAVTHLISGLDSPNEEVRFQTALALSTIPHEKGLLAALKIVQGPTWDRMLPHFRKERTSIIGSFLTIRSRPAVLHDNKSALERRIQLQLASLYENNKDFCTFIEQHPEASSLLDQAEYSFTKISPSTRYIPLPVAYPPNTDLIRGISTRKGSHKFREALRDLLRKGSGTSELTDYDSSLSSGTWNKIGHIFASHNKDLYFGNESGSCYFSTNNDGVVCESALIIFPARYYEKEYQRGQARLEREGSLNNVLYRGIPKRWIKALFLPIRYKTDIEQVAGSEPLEIVSKKLISNLFCGDTIKTLQVFRRHLLAPELDQSRVPGQPVPFVQKLQYFPEVDAKQIGELLQKEDIHFATEEEMQKESAKLSLRMNLIFSYLKV